MYYKDLLRYRQVWLGFALLWVILFHCPIDFGLLNYFKSIGYGGVDVCIFASGIGCFYSLSHDSDVVTFMKRRLKRLVPTYVVFIIVWLAYQYVIGDFNFQMAIGNIFAIQNFTGHGGAFNWYISAIFLLYILAPYFKEITDKANLVQKLMFLAFLLAFSIPFWSADTYIITITRIPLFYIGMLFADLCKKNKKILGKHIVCMIIAFMLGVVALTVSKSFFPQYLWSFGFYWYPFILITPPLCFAISYVSALFEKTKVTKTIVSLLSLCGDYSFELYLIHILLISFISALIFKFELSKSNYIIWVAGGALLVVGCFILRRFTMGMCKFIFSRKQKN